MTFGVIEPLSGAGEPPGWRPTPQSQATCLGVARRRLASGLACGHPRVPDCHGASPVLHAGWISL